jgi:hypothetical protein
MSQGWKQGGKKFHSMDWKSGFSGSLAIFPYSHESCKACRTSVEGPHSKINRR